MKILWIKRLWLLWLQLWHRRRLHTFMGTGDRRGIHRERSQLLLISSKLLALSFRRLAIGCRRANTALVALRLSLAQEK